MIERQKLRQSLIKTAKSFWQLLPVLIGVLLLASLVVQIVPQLIHMGLFGHDTFTDTVVAAVVASISTGQPVVSYLLAGELQKAGIDLVAVTAFLTAWITVGVVSLPAEAVMLGWRFALWRNLIAFLLSMLIAWLTVVTLHV
jgi:uncharacterized membrane protein YraQ (UPF0718 family)